MASSKEFLEFVLDQLSRIEGISARAMMGEYVLYCRGKVVGGIYDDRLLLKPTPGALKLMAEEGRSIEAQQPYKGAKEMLAADVDDRELTCRVVEAIAAELPEPKRKKAKTEPPEKPEAARIRTVDEEIRLIPYYRNDEASLPWYQDPDVCRQVDNTDRVYDLGTLHRMYDFLSTHGECYYIEYRGELVGDVSLRDSAEIAIVVSKEYQNRHIGRKCAAEMLKLAREKGFGAVKANIYSFNEQSKRMFLSLGFSPAGGDWYEYKLTDWESEKTW